MKLLTLIEIEIKKILPWLCILFTGFMIASAGLFYRGIARVNEETLGRLREMSVAEFVEANGQFTLNQVFTGNLLLLYMATAIFIVLLGFYLWYKEWFGYAKRIYLLLSLGGNRFTIVFSKLIVILLALFLFCGVVLFNIWIGSVLLGFIMPDGTVASNLVRGFLQQSSFIPYVIPLTLSDFFYQLAFIILMFGNITLFVLSDRSKKIIGAIFGMVYGIATIALFIYIQTRFLFVDERFFVDWGFVLGMSLLTYGISYWLLQKKVSI